MNRWVSLVALAAASATATAAPPSLASLGVFPYQNRGRTTAAAVPLHATLAVYEVACTRDDVDHTWKCAPAKGLLERALAGQAAVTNFDARRLRQCFTLASHKSDAAIVGGVTRSYDPSGTTETRQAGNDALDARARTEGPTLYLLEMDNREPGGECTCKERDCCLNVRFTAAEERAGHWYHQLWTRSSQPIDVPRDVLATEGTVALYDATPRASEIAALAKSGDWKAAKELAVREAATTTGAPADVRSLALANVIVTAFQARDLAALGTATAALGSDADHRARLLADSLGPAARGEIWLDTDPCTP
jgi:hypothetical protein